MRTASLEVVTSYRSTIAEKHQEAVLAGQVMRCAVEDALEKTRVVGVVLESAKNDLSRNEFEKLCGDLPFSLDCVKSYLAFSRRHTEPAANLKVSIRSAIDASMAMGLLPMPDGHAPQNLRGPPPFFSWTSRIVMQFKLGFSKYLSARPMHTWTKDEAEIFLYSLQPILNVAKRIHQWIQTQR